MERWSADAVAFMRDASEYGSFYARLRVTLLPYLSKDDTICDAGCGLGYLAQAIAGDCRRIVAVDRAEAADKAMRERDLPCNMEPICADVFSLTERFDMLLCSYFGRSAEILRLRERLAPKRTIVIQRSCAAHRFSIGVAEERHGWQGMEAILTERGIPYEKKEIALEFGQPFRTLSDAVRFFELYNKSGAAVTEQAVAARLTPLNDAQYAYYLPQTREMNIYIL
ncbi:MAG: methyltransferase domain-containing protein [Oscillospiraceae bacterium]|nr:methyltransferase domain-containing protein [Oscillospiraceae bacterium]